MVVGDLDVGGDAIFPAEDNAPLGVDANAPEPFEIAGERFESIGWWNAELVDGYGALELAKFHQSPRQNRVGKFPRVFAVEDASSLFAGKVFNHLS